MFTLQRSKTSRSISFFTIAILLLAGCEANTTSVERIAQAPKDAKFEPPINLAYHAPGKPTEVSYLSPVYKSKAAATSAAQRNIEYHSAIVDAIVQASVEEADANLRAAIEQLSINKPEEERTIIKQMAAGLFLQHRLNKIALTDKQLPILEYYVNILLETKNPTAWVLQPALASLEGYWTPEKIRKSALVAYNAAQGHLQAEQIRMSECPECSAKSDAAIDKVPQLKEAKQNQKVSEKRRLELLRAMSNS